MKRKTCLMLVLGGAASAIGLLRYGKAWRIWSMNSMLAGQAVGGTVERMSEGDYRAFC